MCFKLDFSFFEDFEKKKNCGHSYIIDALGVFISFSAGCWNLCWFRPPLTGSFSIPAASHTIRAVL